LLSRHLDVGDAGPLFQSLIVLKYEAFGIISTLTTVAELIEMYV